MTLEDRSDTQMASHSDLNSPHWFAAYTASCREKRVAEHLAMRQIESFLPLYRHPRKWKNGCHVELERPLFPGYVFIRVASTERVRVLDVPNVLSIVSRGSVPEPLHDDIIETLRATLHLRRVEPHAYLAIGEQVSICAGPFAGLSGVVLRNKGKLRVVITLNLIMQSVAVEVNIEDLEPVRFSPDYLGTALSIPQTVNDQPIISVASATNPQERILHAATDLFARVRLQRNQYPRHCAVGCCQRCHGLPSFRVEEEPVRACPRSRTAEPRVRPDLLVQVANADDLSLRPAA